MTEQLLKVNNLCKFFKTSRGMLHAVDDVTFTIDRGKTLGVVGESGCGKSTVLSIISGLLKPTDGRVLYNGAPLSGALSDVGYMLQHDQLFPWSTVEENVSLGLRVRHINTPENRKKIRLMLEDYGLAAFASKYPRELSGGELQRAALARVTVLEPEMILLDEPTSMLDVITQAQMIDFLRRYQQQHQTAYLFITHSTALAEQFCDEIVKMEDGHLLKERNTK